MQEYLSEAIVLDRDPNGDLDIRISLFTKRFGKLVAKAKSTRRITSKLSGHLDIGNLVDARLVEKNGLQVVDALKTGRLSAKPADFYFLNRLLAEAGPDPKLWQLLTSVKLNWLQVLKILGWDPREAVCHACGGRPPVVFGALEQEFFCESCASKIGANEIIYFGESYERAQ